MRHFSDRSATVLRMTPNIIQHSFLLRSPKPLMALPTSTNPPLSICLFIIPPRSNTFPNPYIALPRYLSVSQGTSLDHIFSQVRMYAVDVHPDTSRFGLMSSSSISRTASTKRSTKRRRSIRSCARNGRLY